MTTAFASAAAFDGDAGTARLPASERQAAPGAWSSGGRVERPPATVLDLFLAQARSTPDASAVRCADAVLSYQELDERSDRVAAMLINRGVVTARPVGVSLRRCVDLLPALLGVWKTGAPYLPLDLNLPITRLRGMVAAASCRLVVTHAEHRTRWTGAADVLILEATETRSAAPLDPTTHPSLGNPAYVIYTSGSTGQPKGVLVHHAGLANYVQWAAGNYASQGSGGSPFFSSIGFDLGIPSLFAPLVVGQTVHLLPDPLDLADLSELLIAGGPYSFVKLTPGHLNLLSLDMEPEQAHALAGKIIAAGDTFTSELAQRWMALSGTDGTALATEYGPTEITVGNSGQPVGESIPGRLIPLGRPIPNTTMYVLDEMLEPVPIGVAGEVYVGGVGVSYGYIGDPILTASRFLPDPYGYPGSRLYRTGDRARWSCGGDIEFLGRADRQMKVHGYRIEAAEVQEALRRMPEVADAAVTILGQPARLAAFLVPSRHGVLDRAGIRSQLSRELPDYMIPSIFEIVDAFPLTANGKIDQRALESGWPDDLPSEKQSVRCNERSTVNETTPAAVSQYQVVLNQEEQYSIWPAHREPPSGWQSEGFTGSKQGCLERIAEVWLDLCPLSVRRDSSNSVPNAGM